MRGSDFKTNNFDNVLREYDVHIIDSRDLE